MKVNKGIFLEAPIEKQMEFMWDKLEEIFVLVKVDKKKRLVITAASGFVGGCFVMITMQAKLLWKSIMGS